MKKIKTINVLKFGLSFIKAENILILMSLLYFTACSTEKINAENISKNLLRNPDFELGNGKIAEFWQGSSKKGAFAGRSSSDIKNGTFSYKLASGKEKNKSESPAARVESSPVPVKHNCAYELECWIFIPSRITDDRKGAEISFIPLDSDEKKLPPEKVFKKQKFSVSADYTIPEGSYQKLKIKITDPSIKYLKVRAALYGTGELFLDDFRLTETGSVDTASMRVHKTQNPMFEKLLSDKAYGFIKKGTIYWQHEKRNQAFNFALQYGIEWNDSEYYSRCRKYKLWPLGSPASFRQNRKIYKKYGVKAAINGDMFYLKAAAKKLKNKPVDKERKDPYILDSEINSEMLKLLENDLGNYKGEIFGYQMRDEGMEKIGRQTLYFYNKFGGTGKYPFIDKCNEEVKNKYGYGKYGIPDSQNDGCPFKWIAMRRWCVAMALEKAKRTRDLIKSIDPEIVFFSYDMMSSIKPVQFSLWDGVFDVVLNQITLIKPAPDEPVFACITKIASDLCGKTELWPIPHLHNQMTKSPPNYKVPEVIELMSQMIRNGASGFDIYMPDQPGRMKHKKYYFYCDYIGAPCRWHAEVETNTIMSRINRPDFPRPDFAIFYSNDSNMAKPDRNWQGFRNYYQAAYLMLGQKPETSFRFISDDQIENRKVDLSEYKMLFIPLIKYERESVAKALKKYISEGGIVICTDPEAFTAFSDGRNADVVLKEIFGIKADRKTSFNADRVLFKKTSPINPSSNMSLSLPGVSACRISPEAGAETIAEFAGGAPAVTMNRLGKGQAFFFAFNPFIKKISDEKEWGDFFISLFKNMGIKLNRDIWRYKIPNSEYSHIKPAIPNKTCLTNNFLLWKLSEPYSVRNLNTGGTYSLNPAPRGIKDSGTENIPLSKGKLTNRLQAPVKGNCEQGFSKLNEWIVRWNRPVPISIKFDLKKSYSINELKIFFNGQLGNLELYAGTDQKNMQKVFAENKKISTDRSGVNVFVIKLDKPADARFVELKIGARDKNKKLTMSEIEIWTDAVLSSDAQIPLVSEN